MPKNRVELLAPAGSWDALVAAIENGADAVYLGGKGFNARQAAANFDEDALHRALDYAHVHSGRIYLTLNTIVGDAEMEEALLLAGQAYAAGVDGIIVQDLGLASLLARIFPKLPLHASTQMTVYSADGIKRLESLQFRRVVLARELPLPEIRSIAQASALEVEVFVHGALCISYSGQCLMSSMIGGRSGNRGKCAQPCRMKYQLVGARDCSGYLLSPKDLCGLEFLPELVAAGVAALKIEGRMKSPEYVAIVVSIYRKYLDRVLAGENRFNVAEQDRHALLQIFNRGGFCSGYLEGKTGRDLMSYEKPKNWGVFLGEVLRYDRKVHGVEVLLEEKIAMGDGIEVWNEEEESPGTLVTEMRVSGKAVKEARAGEVALLGSIDGNVQRGDKVYKTSELALNKAARETCNGKPRRKWPINGKVCIETGRPAYLTVWDAEGFRGEAQGTLRPEPALTQPLTEERLGEQIRKTGATPFVFKDLEIVLSSGLLLPIAEINALRREALGKLQQARIQSYQRKPEPQHEEIRKKLLHDRTDKRVPATPPKISLWYQRWDCAQHREFLKVERVYLPWTAWADQAGQRLVEGWRGAGCEVFVALPLLWREEDEQALRRHWDKMRVIGVDGVLLTNLAAITWAAEVPGLRKVSDYQLHTFNGHTLDLLANWGMDGATLSPELNMVEVEAMPKPPTMQLEALVYGRLPLMISEYCPAGCIEGGLTARESCHSLCRQHDFRLRDRTGSDFPIICDPATCRSVVLNTHTLFVPDLLPRLSSAGVKMGRLLITDEDSATVAALVALYRDAAQQGSKALEHHEKITEKIKSGGWTRGHYFRGV